MIYFFYNNRTFDGFSFFHIISDFFQIYGLKLKT